MHALKIDEKVSSLCRWQWHFTLSRNLLCILHRGPAERLMIIFYVLSEWWLGESCLVGGICKEDPMYESGGHLPRPRLIGKSWTDKIFFGIYNYVLVLYEFTIKAELLRFKESKNNHISILASTLYSLASVEKIICEHRFQYLEYEMVFWHPLGEGTLDVAPGYP